MTFEPKKLVSVPIGKAYFNFYPQIDATMPIWEHTHVFHINRSATILWNANLHLQLEALGSQLNLESIVDGSKADFLDYYYHTNWVNFHHLQILSFHDAGGRIINPATCCIPADLVVLKPVQNGNQNVCCPAGIKFVRVQLLLDFSHLLTALPLARATPLSLTLRAEYNFELPQNHVNLVNGAGAVYVLSTYPV
jgi:hypothetical protein